MSFSPVLTREQYEKLPPEKRSRPLTDAEYDALTKSQRIAGGLDEPEEGAPTDFGGAVFPNPTHIRVHDDSEPNIPITRLPQGVTFKKDNYAGDAKIDLSNPVPAEVIPAAGREISAKMSTQPTAPPWEKYSQASSSENAGPWSKYGEPSAASPIAPPKFTVGAPSSQPMETVLTPHEFGERLREPNHPLPGVSEGEGLREGLAEYDRAGFGTVGKGAVDLAHGKIARGGHEVISGTMNALTPAAPLVIPGAPLAAARGIIGGAAGGYIAREGAEALGANPDQADLAGDIGGVGGGIAGAELPTLARGPARVAGRVLGRIGSAADPDLVGIASPRTANALRFSQKLGRVANKIAGAEAPAAEAPELLQSRSLATGPRVVTDPAAPLGRIPVRTEAIAAPAAAAEPAPSALTTPSGRIKPAVSAELDRALDQATGGKGLIPGTPLKSQPGALGVFKSAMAARELPEGFTPVESSALKGYKYDPDAQELTTITKNGTSYTHGEVTPEEAKAFGDADSKGAAWKQVRDNHVLVKQNGKPVKPIASRSALPEDAADTATEDAPKPTAKRGKAKAAAPSAADEDLTPTLQQMLKQVKGKKSAAGNTGKPLGTYDALIQAALKEGPAWTPEKATPVLTELNRIPGNEFEVRGSVGEGRSTDNDLDLWQKSGSLKDARATLEKLGFKYNGKTPHGETYTNGAQHVDLWDTEHEPIKGYKGASVEARK